MVSFWIIKLQTTHSMQHGKITHTHTHLKTVTLTLQPVAHGVCVLKSGVWRGRGQRGCWVSPRCPLQTFVLSTLTLSVCVRAERFVSLYSLFIDTQTHFRFVS